MKKLSFFTAFLFCAHAQKIELSKKYIDLSLGLTSLYGTVNPYTATGSDIPPANYKREFYTYRFSTLRTDSKSSVFRPAASLSLGYDFKVNQTPLMMGVFVGAGYGRATFQAAYDGGRYNIPSISEVDGLLKLRALKLSTSTLAATGVGSSALTGDANNGDIKAGSAVFAKLANTSIGADIKGASGKFFALPALTMTSSNSTAFATIGSGAMTGNIKGNNATIGTTAQVNISASNGSFATIDSTPSTTITGNTGVMGSLPALTLTSSNATNFATIDSGSVTGNIVGNNTTMGTTAAVDIYANTTAPFATLTNPTLAADVQGNGTGVVGTVSMLKSAVDLNAKSNVATTDLQVDGPNAPNSGVADISLPNSRMIQETLFVNFREKANINGGFRIGVPKGDFFPHLRLGYSLLLMSAEIKRTNPETLDLEVFKVSKAVSALSVGVGVDFQVTSRFAVGATFDCAFGQNARFNFAKKNMLSAPGKIDSKLAVKFRPTVSTFMVNAKFEFPVNRPSV